MSHLPQGIIPTCKTKNEKNVSHQGIGKKRERERVLRMDVWLVVFSHPSEKYARQIGSLPQFSG